MLINKLLFALMLTSCFMFSSCIRKYTKFIGFYDPKLVANTIKIGDDTEFILSKFGSPSFKSDDGKIWYYTRVNGSDGMLISFTPISQETTEISISQEGKVIGIKTFASKKEIAK